MESDRSNSDQLRLNLNQREFPCETKIVGIRPMRRSSPLSSPRLDSGFLRHKFTPDEDIQLRQLVESMGSGSWEEIAKHVADRSARQCRDRYKNYLVDSLVIDGWTPEEDALVIRQFHLIGPKWVEIGKMLSGRSGNNVKNRWHKHLCKIERVLEPPRDPPTPERREQHPTPVVEESPVTPPQKLLVGESDWPWLFRSIEMPTSLDTPWSGAFSLGDSFM
jgi:hypothetical protein